MLSPLRIHPVALALALSVSAACAHAATVGYWRFETNTPSANRGTDSGPNGLNLTNNNTVSSITTPFGATIPLTGDANVRAASLSRSSSQYFSRGDSSAFAFNSFTIEAFVNASSFQSGTNVSTIAAQFNNGAANNSAWLFGVTGSGSSLGANELLIQLSNDGIVQTNFDSNIKLNTGTNYYVAAAVSTGVAGASVTFYVKDLTAGTTLQTTLPVTSSVVTSLYNSSTNFTIGASYNNNNISRFFDGAMDEIRLSNTALGESGLLVSSIPEPASFAFVAGFLMLAASSRRRPRA